MMKTDTAEVGRFKSAVHPCVLYVATFNATLTTGWEGRRCEAVQA